MLENRLKERDVVILFTFLGLLLAFLRLAIGKVLVGEFSVFPKLYYSGYSFEKEYYYLLLNKEAFISNLILPVLIIVLYFIMSKKIPSIWKKMQIKATSAFLIAYIFGVFTTLTFWPIDTGRLLSMRGDILPIFIIVLLTSFIFSIVPLAHSSILTIGAAFILTKEIKSLTKRIIIGFFIVFLLSSASASSYSWALAFG